MIQENYSSKLLADAVAQFSKLPGIGERSALRLVLFLMRLGKEDALTFTKTLNLFFENIKFCSRCHNISDGELCSVCSSPKRNAKTICVIENIKDLMAIENTHQFNGLYHILGGIISPIDGIGPGDLKIQSLIERVEEEKPEEIILALSATMEGDTTNYYLYKKLKDYPLRITMIARGVAFGDELEYTNEITLGRSILNRIPFENPESR